jgi:hypothetical protein
MKRQYKIAVQGMDDTAAFVHEVVRLCKEGYLYVAYTDEDDDDEEGGVGLYAILSDTEGEITYEEAISILRAKYPPLV